MMMDFTLKKYEELLRTMGQNGYHFVTFERYCSEKEALSDKPFVILRHDVDLKAENALAMAKLEHSLGVKASYYFRVVEQSNNPDVIKAIVEMGHEIGYHYEDLTICGGDTEKTIAHFQEWLAYFRQFYPVKTICMHGSPRSRFDNRDLWKQFDYHDFGVFGEPYFDLDFLKVFYLTDTGRRWDGFRMSVRDRVPQQEEWVRNGLVYHATDDIICASNEAKLPKQLMMTTHPQRWTDNKAEWLVELVSQSAKNVVKRVMVLPKNL